MLTVEEVTGPPCSLEIYTRVLAELARGDGKRRTDTLETFAFTRATWRAAELYWSPRIASEDHPKFSPGQATRFRVLMAQATGRNEIAREVDFARAIGETSGAPSVRRTS